MSHTYHMLCVTCREVLDVGKLVTLTEDGVPCALKFGSWRDIETGGWVSRDTLLAAVERFLILHRVHEIRLVPELYLTTVDPEDTLHYIDAVSDLMKRPVEPAPDDELDAQAVPVDVTERLRADSGRGKDDVDHTAKT